MRAKKEEGEGFLGKGKGREEVLGLWAKGRRKGIVGKGICGRGQSKGRGGFFGD